MSTNRLIAIHVENSIEYCSEEIHGSTINQFVTYGSHTLASLIHPHPLLHNALLRPSSTVHTNSPHQCPYVLCRSGNNPDYTSVFHGFEVEFLGLMGSSRHV